MGVMISDSPGNVPELIRTAALSEGVLLHQLRNAIFDPSPGKRFVSRYLVSLWLADNHRAGMSLLRRVVPSGLLHYLGMPGMSAEEADKLEEDEPAAGGGQAANFGGASQGAKDAKRKNKRDSRLSRLRLRIQSQSGNGASAIRSLKGENFAVFFSMATLDHTLPDLIWNQNTKTELRTAMEAEEREFERERDLAGSKRTSFSLLFSLPHFSPTRSSLPPSLTPSILSHHQVSLGTTMSLKSTIHLSTRRFELGIITCVSFSTAAVLVTEQCVSCAIQHIFLSACIVAFFARRDLRSRHCVCVPWRSSMIITI
jgi:hypothetical protein